HRPSGWAATPQSFSASIFSIAETSSSGVSPYSVNEAHAPGPARGVAVDLDVGERFVALERTIGLDHHGVLVCELLRLAGLDRGGLRPVLKALRVMGDERLADPRPREELALVIEEHLVFV